MPRAVPAARPSAAHPRGLPRTRRASVVSGIRPACPVDARVLAVQRRMVAVRHRERLEPPVKALADHAPPDVRDPVRREPELLEDRARGRGGAEVVDPDDRALVADPALPAHRDPGLDGDPLADRRRKDAITIGLVLRVEALPARPADDARRDPVGLERFGRREAQLELAARPDEDQLRRPARRLAEDVAATADAFTGAVLRARERRQLLARE